MHQYFLRYCFNASIWQLVVVGFIVCHGNVKPNEFTRKTNLFLYAFQYFELQVLKRCFTVLQLIYRVQVKQIFVCCCTVC